MNDKINGYKADYYRTTGTHYRRLYSLIQHLFRHNLAYMRFGHQCYTIDDDVLIAPNSYVNFDVPAHSVVIGNPGKIYANRHATDGYIGYCILRGNHI